MTLSLHIEESFDNIDARLFTGDPSKEELAAMEDWIARFQRRIEELNSLHEEPPSTEPDSGTHHPPKPK